MTQEGSDGEKEITELIRKRNGQIIGRSILEEKVLVEPKEQITVVGTKVMPSRGSGSFKWPQLEDIFQVKWERVGEERTEVSISPDHPHVQLRLQITGLLHLLDGMVLMAIKLSLTITMAMKHSMLIYHPLMLK